MSEWLQHFNAADRAGLENFIRQHYSAQNLGDGNPVQLSRAQMRFRQRTGGLDLYAIEKSSDVELTALFKTRAILAGFVRGSYQIDPAHPETIVRSGFGPGPAPPGAFKKLSATALARDLDPKLQQLTATDQFSGVVLIAKNGKPLWQKAYGYRDREKQLPNTLDTRFRLGSMNKMFTAVAIAHLVQAGKLNFNQTIAEILPDYPNAKAASQITVDELLSHRSGIPDYFTDEYDSKKDELRSLKDYLPLFANQPAEFAPGAQYSYSNSNFIVLGLMIEKLSGESYYDYVEQHIYRRAGMQSSGTWPKNQTIDNLAIGYTQAPGGKLENNYPTLPARGTSAGGGDSTVGDLLRFAQALRSYKLLNRELTDVITTGKVQMDPGDPSQKYGYGFGESRVNGHRLVGHNGGAPGMNADFEIYWNEGYVIAVLANLDPPAAGQVAEYIQNQLE